MGMGVLVTLENSGNLSCQFDGASGENLPTIKKTATNDAHFIDPSGVMEGVKAVAFRVELHGVLRSHAVAGFTCSVSLIQEKGALSSFKLVYNRLRREWQLDAPTPILKTAKSALSSAMSARRSYDL